MGGRGVWAGLGVLLVLGCGAREPTAASAVDPARVTRPGEVAPPANAAPGPGAPVFELAAAGVGACSGMSLQDVIAGVHAQRPELADVKELYRPDPQRGGDGSFIHAFSQERGFALAFKRGGGDCPAGCTDNEYWYFATDESCIAREVGHYRAGWDTGSCLTTSGEPLWGIPRPPDPNIVCRADNRPQLLSGTYRARGTGSRVACTAERGSSPNIPVALLLSIIVTQDPADLSRGTIQIQGTGHPLIDGQPLPATFTRRRLSVSHEASNLPAACIDQHAIAFEQDLEDQRPGRLHFTEVRSLDCPPGQDYCKGLLDLELTLEN